jgi:hypothetical protein
MCIYLLVVKKNKIYTKGKSNMIEANLLFILLVILVLWAISSTQERGMLRELFDPNDRSSMDYISQYEVDIKTKCSPGEVDTGDHCVKVGCPPGFERGVGSGSDRCYPLCLHDYESNGMSRCYQKCPLGYETEETMCIRPRDVYKKDAIPCTGCVPIPDPYRGDPLVDRLIYDSYSTAPRPPTVVTRPLGPRYRSTRGYRSTGYNILEGFENELVQPSSGNGSEAAPPLEETVPERPMEVVVQEPAGPEPVPDDPGAKPTSIVSAPAPATQPQQQISKENAAALKRIQSDYVGRSEGACPLGYALSGDMCFENCPANYKDTGMECARPSYVIDRPSYDRGGGVPYRVIRNKHSRLMPGN